MVIIEKNVKKWFLIDYYWYYNPLAITRHNAQDDTHAGREGLWEQAA